MGLFAKKIAELNVTFYEDVFFGIDYSVDLKSDLDPMNLLNMFLSYYERIEFNIGKQKLAVINSELRNINTINNQDFNILNFGKYKPNKKSIYKSSTKVNANFLDDNRIVIKYSGPKIEMYSAYSISAFFEYIYHNLNEQDFSLFIKELVGFLKRNPSFWDSI